MPVYRMLMDVSANVLWRCGAAGNRQHRAYALARFLAPVLQRTFGPLRPGSPPYTAKIFNSLMTRFSRISPGFALDVAIDNRSLVTAALQQRNGVLVATVHSALALAFHGIRDGMGRPPVFVGNQQDDMTGWNWGGFEPIVVLDAEDPTVLVKARSAAENGRIVVAFVDFNEPAEGPQFISPNAFSLAHSMQLPVLHMLCTLEPTGRIRIHLAAEPEHLANPRQKARAFAQFIETLSGARIDIRRPKDTGLQGNATERSPGRGLRSRVSNGNR
ncbi:hypothetical protein [Novosphingobium sp. PASSN1]|uniref:hypothetical protein n=1 Tax=Novosphingobium sp. PASSN1 TaxID=2015561 RepID=UPI000BDCA564|nr:hypothetical protein [Novosphingobium sp. PASSN1]OYU35676.1 MAG: hypothetical protein CFE35_09225 [Novosphingobium sp. PASSN1]